MTHLLQLSHWLCDAILPSCHIFWVHCSTNCPSVQYAEHVDAPIKLFALLFIPHRPLHDNVKSPLLHRRHQLRNILLPCHFTPQTIIIQTSPTKSASVFCWTHQLITQNAQQLRQEMYHPVYISPLHQKCEIFKHAEYIYQITYTFPLFIRQTRCSGFLTMTHIPCFHLNTQHNKSLQHIIHTAPARCLVNFQPQDFGRLRCLFIRNIQPLII